jgi:hypothetical protein
MFRKYYIAKPWIEYTQQYSLIIKNIETDKEALSTLNLFKSNINSKLPDGIDIEELIIISRRRNKSAHVDIHLVEE